MIRYIDLFFKSVNIRFLINLIVSDNTGILLNLILYTSDFNVKRIYMGTWVDFYKKHVKDKFLDWNTAYFYGDSIFNFQAQNLKRKDI